jgi:hypothetical protein
MEGNPQHRPEQDEPGDGSPELHYVDGPPSDAHDRPGLRYAQNDTTWLPPSKGTRYLVKQIAKRSVSPQPSPGASEAPRWMSQQRCDRLPVLGVDIGGVIVHRVAENSDTSFFGARPLDTPVVDGAIEELSQLVTSPFEWRVYLVSKARSTTAATTRRWLEHIDFFRRTGIPRQNLHFVTDRLEKAPICERFGVTHFVDDRLEVLNALTTVPRRYLFTGGLGDSEPPALVPDGIAIVDNWVNLGHQIMGTAYGSYQHEDL